ncbi:TPA: hypothetical protein EYN65_17040 [Candidatus Poribacteria bacterium]|nr:hypothetical protein [Candidatus Poribacteria bacterium]HIC00639.1 hypothetical protein [Candidatus Poribacteria bacterium]HIC18080.1 hypothetical protein [Candidatus Poribacteria bacterium]HIM11216.1 hypothetical protein [Candidatus Poribacteria bacterium]HIN29611.1 hypothetical protein [Candidatus Poribacteria bacterium]
MEANLRDNRSESSGWLTSQQVEQFKDDGLLIIRGLLPSGAMQPLIDEMTQKVDMAIDEAVKLGLLDRKFEDASFSTRLALAEDAGSDHGWLWQSYFRDQKPRSNGMFILRSFPILLNTVESLIGPEILAHPQFNIRAKMPDQQITVIPWHQDLAYLVPEEAGETLVVNLWIPLVTAHAKNGCMQLLRGSHHLGLLPHDYRDQTPGHTGSKGIAETDLPDYEIVTAELDIGDVLATTERLIHRGIPNRSKNTVRWSVDTRYSQIGLPTGRENVPGFVARSHNRPESVAKTYRDWNRLFL